MKKFFNEFKAFISKGDVVSMAVGLMVGSAFTAIITALNANILTPLLGIIMGGISFEDIIFTVGAAEVQVGLFIQAIINFILVAFSVFVMVRAINKLKDAMTKKQREEEEAAKKAAEAAKEPEAPPEPSEEILLLREIRDSLKK